MNLYSAVQICRGTSRRFSRPSWYGTVEVLASCKEFESAYGDWTAYTDLAVTDTEPFVPDTGDIFADDYEVVP